MAERPMIRALILNGINAYRVINDSINPARIKKGTRPMTILEKRTSDGYVRSSEAPALFPGYFF